MGDSSLALTAENPGMRKLVYFLWFLFLFEPARLISFYIPPLSPLKLLPELLLYAAMAMWLFSSAPKRNMKWFTAFFFLTIFGTVIAFIFGNWGVARLVVRMLFQYYALGLLTLTFCKDREGASTVLRLYFFSFLYYAVWGLISLQLEPIVDEIDPGIRQIVHWHIHFNNRDGFGPLMVMGLTFAFYFRKVVYGRFMRLAATATLLLCVMGILTSFGRGVFLASTATVAYMWYKARRKMLGIAVLIGVIVVLRFAASDFTDRYLSTISTIFNEGASGGTGLDRKILWGWAWREFLGSPIFGVGTGNFGIAIFRFVSLEEIVSSGYTPGRLWGRSLHSAPMTVLCEYGLVGAAVMVGLIVDYIKTNVGIHRNVLRLAQREEQYYIPNDYFSWPSAMIAIAHSLIAMLIAVLVSAFFYELLYTPLLWHLAIINQLFYLVSRDVAENGEPSYA